jgi:hypothetical protein
VFSIKRASDVVGGSCVRESSHRPCVVDSFAATRGVVDRSNIEGLGRSVE